MLPGVECARRRRFHRSGINGGYSDSRISSDGRGMTRRSSVCLYTTSHESNIGLISFSVVEQRGSQNQAYGGDEKLIDTAREAKERLDERLRRGPQWKSDTNSCIFSVKKHILGVKG